MLIHHVYCYPCIAIYVYIGIMYTRIVNYMNYNMYIYVYTYIYTHILDIMI